jgi:itaconate CoA-transferase
MTLNLKHPEAKAILTTLLEKADVIVQNLTPGGAARLGLSYEVLHQKYPKLIVCDISGYGSGGPFGDKKAYDLLIQGESGFLSITGNGVDYAKAGNSIADISAGMYAYSNILAALLERSKTSKGKWIDISMLECMVEWMGYPLYYAFEGSDPPPRTGATHATIYPYGPFVAGDGGVVMFGLQNDREWASFCEKVLQRPELGNDPRFMSNASRAASRDKLQPILSEVFLALTAAQLVDRLDRAQIANARVNTMSEVWTHPQLKMRNRWFEVQTPIGPVPTLLPPGVSSTVDISMDEVPDLGADTDTILTELGYHPIKISQLHRDGVI